MITAGARFEAASDELWAARDAGDVGRIAEAEAAYDVAAQDCGTEQEGERMATEADLIRDMHTEYALEELGSIRAESISAAFAAGQGAETVSAEELAAMGPESAATEQTTAELAECTSADLCTYDPQPEPEAG